MVEITFQCNYENFWNSLTESINSHDGNDSENKCCRIRGGHDRRQPPVRKQRGQRQSERHQSVPVSSRWDRRSSPHLRAGDLRNGGQSGADGSHPRQQAAEAVSGVCKQ